MLSRSFLRTVARPKRVISQCVHKSSASPILDRAERLEILNSPPYVLPGHTKITCPPMVYISGLTALNDITDYSIASNHFGLNKSVISSTLSWIFSMLCESYLLKWSSFSTLSIYSCQVAETRRYDWNCYLLDTVIFFEVIYLTLHDNHNFRRRDDPLHNEFDFGCMDPPSY